MSGGGESEPSTDAYTSSPTDVPVADAAPLTDFEKKVRAAEGNIALAAGAAEYDAQQEALRQRRAQGK